MIAKPRPVALTVSVIVVLLVLSGCSARRSPYVSHGRPGPAAQHALHDETLRQLMRMLERLSGDRLPQEMDVTEQRRQRWVDVAETAVALRDAASRIPEVLRGVRLDSEARDEFMKLVRDLETHAGDLQLHARAGDLDEASEALDCITTTCMACHNAFRILPAVRPPESDR